MKKLGWILLMYLMFITMCVKAETIETRTSAEDFVYRYITNETGETTAVISGYIGSATNIVLPMLTPSGIPITEIDTAAFSCATYLDQGNDFYNKHYQNHLKLESIVIPSNIITIGTYAFYDSNISYITISNGVNSIGDHAFYGCNNLTTIYLPDSVYTIGKNAFQSCSELKNVTISNNITAIEPYTFGGCSNLSNIVLPNKLLFIGSHAFFNCRSLSNLMLPENIVSIGSDAFYGCDGLKDISIPNLVTTIADRTFFGCSSLANIYLHDNIDSIGIYAFSGCVSLTEIEIPKNVVSIGDGAFNYCKSLVKATISQATTHIGLSAFRGCSQLQEIYFLGNAPEVYANTASSPSFEADIVTLYYIPFNTGWSTPLWNGYKCYPTYDMPMMCPHMDEYGNHYVETRPDNWEKEDYPHTWGEYQQYDATYHNVKTYWNFICSNCNQEATLISEWKGEHAFGSNGKCEACGYYGRHNSLETLTDVDYLAFSSLAYKDVSIYNGMQNVSIYEMLMDDKEWNEYWEGTDIRVSELFGYIRDWEFIVDEENLGTGFYAMAFRNDKNEVVIAYRGSVPFSVKWLNVPHFSQDWIFNDLVPILSDSTTPFSQYRDAVNFYTGFTYGRTPEDIAVTGHSLGGGLANVVSAYSGSRGVAFNGVAILDTNYYYHPESMSINFKGIDNWNYVDHVNEFDTYAGTWEVGYKNAFIHQSIDQSLKGKEPPEWLGHLELLDYLRNAPKTHGLNTITYKHSNGEVTLTNGSESKAKYNFRELGDAQGDTEKEDPVIGAIDLIERALYLGNSTDDIFQLVSNDNKSLSESIEWENKTYVAYGGSGADIITTYTSNDTLIGGPGNDYLDGGTWGNDLYIYNKGDGLDYIVDTVGNDEIHLQGFDENDEIRITVPTERQYVYYTTGNKMCVQSESKKGAAYSVITCNGEPIICVDKNRADNIWNKLTLNIDGKKRDITSEIQPYIVTIVNHYEFHCPIDIDILDANGNVVYTVKDSQLGNFYTDYGNFYVLPNEDSKHNSKILDLFEGYSIQIRGIANGSMNVLAQNTDSYALLDAYAATNVPVTSSMIATLEEDPQTGVMYLAIDTNGDGIIDQRIPLTPVHTSANDHDKPLQKVAAVAPTCIAPGSMEYYVCSCGKLFIDPEGKNEITDLNSLILPATSNHQYANGLCTVCGHKEPTIPKTGDSTPLAALAALLVFSGTFLLINLKRKHI